MGRRRCIKNRILLKTQHVRAQFDMESVPETDMDSNDLCSSQESTLRDQMQLNDDTSWYEATPDLTDPLAFPLLEGSETPVKPPSKKHKRESNQGGKEKDNAAILEAIRELSAKQDETFRKVSAIETTTNSTSKQMEKLTATVRQLTVDVHQQKQSLDSVQNEIVKLQAENKLLKENVAECQRYGRRWSLKVHGVKETKDEDIRGKIVGVLGRTAPMLRDSLKEGVDVVHRIGKQRQDGSSRSTIVLFAMRRLRDAVWREAKGSQFLQENHLRITEALSPEDKAAREKLWPLVKKAREEGKKASFRGASAVINGKIILCSEVT